MSVLSRTFLASRLSSTVARLESTLLIPARAEGEPGAPSCSEKSGSLSQRSEDFGTSLSQKDSVRAFVVHRSCAPIGIRFLGNAPNEVTTGACASCGNLAPANNVVEVRADSDARLIDRPK